MEKIGGDSCLALPMLRGLWSSSSSRIEIRDLKQEAPDILYFGFERNGVDLTRFRIPSVAARGIEIFGALNEWSVLILQ